MPSSVRLLAAGIAEVLLMVAPPDSRTTTGRAWPLLNGERGEQQIATGDLAGAGGQLRAMTNAAGPGDMLSEQVWDKNPRATPGRSSRGGRLPRPPGEAVRAPGPTAAP